MTLSLMEEENLRWMDDMAAAVKMPVEVLFPKTYQVEYYRRSSLVNETATACRVVHVPSGIEARSQEEGSRRYNRNKAMERLKKKLYHGC